THDQGRFCQVRTLIPITVVNGVMLTTFFMENGKRNANSSELVNGELAAIWLSEYLHNLDEKHHET
ncbi:hypothetical protein KIN20_001687, partial [Parelaphostrongylus tenuis]